MGSMAKIAGDHKRDELIGGLNELVDYVESAGPKGDAAHEVEHTLWRKMLQLGGELLGLYFQGFGEGDEGEEVVLPTGRLKRSKDLHRREYQSVFGGFELCRWAYAKREGQKMEYIPFDEKLQLPGSKFSYLLQDWNQSLVMEAPYAKVNDTLEKILGFTHSVDSLERTNRKMSEDVNQFWEDLETPSPEEEGELLVTTADAKGVPIRGLGEQTPPCVPDVSSSSSATKSGVKKMALLGGVYTIDRFVRTPEDVHIALFRDSDAAEESEKKSLRPKPLNNYIRASLMRDSKDTSSPSYEEIFGWMGKEVQARSVPLGGLRGSEAAEGIAEVRLEAVESPQFSQIVLALMDGQESLWNASRKYVGQENVTEILDLMHALKYLWDAAHLFFTKGSAAAETFMRERTYTILRGGVKSVVRGLRRMASLHGFSDEKREKLEVICRYFNNNAPRMAYDEYLAAGYPIATGVIEGACRNLVNDRMERCGARWVVEGAHAMLGLRSIHLSGVWSEFIKHRIQEETLRLYPHSAANDDFKFPIAA